MFPLLKPLVRRSLPEDPDEFRLSLVEHLDELRRRIMHSAIFVVIGSIVGWQIQPWVFQLFEKIVMDAVPKGVKSEVAFTNITDPFMLKLNNSVVLGLIITAPFLIWQIWGFVAPGLKAEERKPFKMVAPLAILLFAMGTGFCWIVLPSAYKFFADFFADFGGSVLFQDPGKMVSFGVKMILAFGIGFQLPIVVFALNKFGIVSEATLSKYWRHSTVAIFFLSAILTPSNDMFSMMMMAVPLTILFLGALATIRLTALKQPWPAELNALD